MARSLFALLALATTAAVAGQSCYMPASLPSFSADVDSMGFAVRNGKLTLDNALGLCYTKESIRYLVEHWGIGVFRASMYVGEDGYASDPSLRSKVEEVVRWCDELRIYVIIDWHVLTLGDPNAPTFSGALAFWEAMATAYKDKTHVLYELANEPNAVDWPTVKEYHDRIIPAIRSIDPHTIILAGTPTWSQDIQFAAASPVSMPYNVMYTFHFYAGTHQGLLPRLRKYATKIPLFVTEWGTTTVDGQYGNGDGGIYVQTAFSFLELMCDAESSTGVTISFAQWSYSDKAEASAALVPGSCASRSWEPLHDIANALALAIALTIALALTLTLAVAVAIALALAIALAIAITLTLASAIALARTDGPHHDHVERWLQRRSDGLAVDSRAFVVIDFSGTDVTILNVWGAQLMSSVKKVSMLKLADYDALMVGFTAQGSAQAPTGMRCAGESSMPSPSPSPSPSPTPELQPCTRQLTEIEMALSASVSSLHQSLMAAIITGSIGVVVGRLSAIRVAGQADKQPA
ncbi:glycoside hydrolase superfamily [Pavlovales sp. CCMP2436]|nr:glycoside hydrolase superfamily [Pavlovales sp. CCMP2436]